MSIEEMLHGMDVFFYTTDNGPSFPTQCKAYNAALTSYGKIKYAIKAQLSTDLSGDPRCYDFPVTIDSLNVEKELRAVVPEGAIMLRLGLLFENIGYWRADDVRKFHTLIAPPQAPLHYVLPLLFPISFILSLSSPLHSYPFFTFKLSLFDASECCAKVLADPASYLHMGDKYGGITLTGYPCTFEEFVTVIIDVCTNPGLLLLLLLLLLLPDLILSSCSEA